jgi:hypothetical protein
MIKLDLMAENEDGMVTLPELRDFVSRFEPSEDDKDFLFYG